MINASREHVQTMAECAELILLRSPGEAVQILEGVRVLRPNSPEVAVILGRAYAQNRQLDLAEKEFLRALALDPGQPYAEVCLAEVMLRNGGTTDECRVRLRRATELDTSPVGAIAELARQVLVEAGL